MDLENQVTSLELSKRLKELGFKQESLFYWSKNGGQKWKIENSFYFKVDKRADISAYTAADLGDMLPEYVEKDEKIYWLKGYKLLEYVENYTYNSLCIFRADTEADARAKMLIYLRENNLI